MSTTIAPEIRTEIDFENANGIVVFGKPGCMPCRSTKRAFESAGVEITYVDITENPAALDHVMSLGHTSMPVVVAGAEVFSGYRPERIEQLIVA